MIYIYIYIYFHSPLSEKMERSRTTGHSSRGKEEDMELPMFDLSTISRATDDFSLNNKLGEGGFGPVYKVNLQCVGKVNSKEILLILFRLFRLICKCELSGCNRWTRNCCEEAF